MKAKNAIDAVEETNPAANRGFSVPERIVEQILALLEETGEQGARRDEIAQAIDRPENTVKRWLRSMRDQGLITVRGNTKAARYLLPEHADDPTDDDHEQ